MKGRKEHGSEEGEDSRKQEKDKEAFLVFKEGRKEGSKERTKKRSIADTQSGNRHIRK
jgi:hypothetical protein